MKRIMEHINLWAVMIAFACLVVTTLTLYNVFFYDAVLIIEPNHSILFSEIFICTLAIPLVFLQLFRMRHDMLVRRLNEKNLS